MTIHSIMAILIWLKFRDIGQFRLYCIIHKAMCMGFPEYLSNRFRIRATRHISRKCELMKLSVLRIMYVCICCFLCVFSEVQEHYS